MLAWLVGGGGARARRTCLSRAPTRADHAVGPDDQKTWDELVFEKVDPGVDPSIIRENLKLSPTERVGRCNELWPSSTI